MDVGAVDGAAAGADVVGVVELGAVVELGVVVAGADVVGAEGLEEDEGAVVVVDAPVVVAAVSARALGAGTTARPTMIAAAAAGSAPRRTSAVLYTGRERARVRMSSEVRGWSDNTAGRQQACDRVGHSLVVP
ncbi:MAG TPA: hypothetical protein VHY77_08525 [Acidimicrobiales bacterium]|nr:hypothetical protein [Acidimicrobiales bacterium]